MRTHRTVPFVTLTLALISTVIKIVWLMGRDYSAWITANLDVLSWPTFYDQPWRVFTSPFIHRDIVGFLVNVAFLLLFGWQIERKYGWAMFLGIFFGALVTAYILWTNVAHDWIVGISIGVCGLFGFSLIANRRSPWWTTVTHRPPHALYLANLLGVLIANVTNLIPGRVAHLGHLFGRHGIWGGFPAHAAWRLLARAGHCSTHPAFRQPVLQSVASRVAVGEDTAETCDSKCRLPITVTHSGFLYPSAYHICERINETNSGVLAGL